MERLNSFPGAEPSISVRNKRICNRHGTGTMMRLTDNLIRCLNWCMARQCSYASVLSGFCSMLRLPPIRAVKNAKSKPNEFLFCAAQLQQRIFQS